MNLDIHAAINTVVFLVILGAIFSFWRGVRSIRQSRDAVYYRIHRRLVSSGWWLIVFTACLLLLAATVATAGEPAAYVFFRPSPTLSLTPTITRTPTISLTPTITLTPTVTLTPVFSYTPTTTGTPFMPEAIEAQFTSLVTPNPKSIFSPLSFSRAVQKYKPVNPQSSFQNPVDKIFVTYSYDGMSDGVQWTLLWYRGTDLLKYDTSTWSGGTGGLGQYELDLPTGKWLPGSYQVIFFVGMEWKAVGDFRIVGNPPTPTLTPKPSLTPTGTATIHPTDTRWPSMTPTTGIK